MLFFIRNCANKFCARWINPRRLRVFAKPAALVGFLLIVAFFICTLVLAQTQTRTTALFRFVSTGPCKEKYDYSDSSVSLNGTPVTVKRGNEGSVYVDYGALNVTALSEPDYPEAKLVAVRLYYAGRVIEEKPAGTSLNIDPGTFPADGTTSPLIEIVTANDCRQVAATPEQTPEPEAKKAEIYLESMGCNKENHLDYLIRIDDTVLKPYARHGTKGFPIKPGPHHISVSVPGHPSVKINSANVLTSNEELAGQTAPDSAGNITIDLKSEFFLGKKRDYPMVFLFLENDCDADYEPPPQRIDAPPLAKVAAFKGNAYITRDDSDARSPITKGSMIEDQQIIVVGPGASVELVTSDKRLIILPAETVVKMSVTKKDDNTWGLEPSIRKGTVIVRHVRYERGAGTPSWKVSTPTATVTDKQTSYSVYYNESAKDTVVGVEDGQVEVTPTNKSLSPFTLDAHQRAGVDANRISTIGYFFSVDDPSGLNTKGENLPIKVPNDILLVGGIVLAVLVGLVVLIVIIFTAYRLLRRKNRRPGYAPPGAYPPALPPARTPAPANSRRCPRCGQTMPLTGKFCMSCGTLMV